MAGCNCDMGLGNTGRPNCVPIQSVTSKLILVPLYDVFGNKNRIVLNDGFLDYNLEFINASEPSQRWFPLPEFENVEMPKADAQFEESNSGRMVFLRQGKRSFTGELWADDSSPQLLGKLQMNRCVDFGVFIVDVNGNLIGSQAEGDIPDFLYPIPVDNPSWNPTLQFATDSTTQKIVVAFDFDRNFDESTLYMLTSAEAGQDILALSGLVDVNFYNFNQPSLTQLDFSAWLTYGTASSKIKFTGANISDFQLVDNTTGSTIALDSISEDLANKGNYQLFLDGTMVDGNSYTLKVIKTGFTGSYTFVCVD
jgi:hypothetical protein